MTANERRRGVVLNESGFEKFREQVEESIQQIKDNYNRQKSRSDEERERDIETKIKHLKDDYWKQNNQWPSDDEVKTIQEDLWSEYFDAPNDRIKYLCNISPDTLAKIRRKHPVDPKSLMNLFNGLKVEITEKYYEYPYDPTLSTGTDTQSSTEDDNDHCCELMEFELAQGYVPSQSYFYVERPPIEENCKKYIMQPGSLVRIRAPKQMGKTSLLSGILDEAESKKYKTATIDFQMIDRALLTDLDRFLQWFCVYVAKQLELMPEHETEDWWNTILGSKVNAHDYFEEHLLHKTKQPILLALDEVDRLFEEPIAEDFFTLLRAWHEEAKRNETWKRLRLVLVHSTEEYIPTNINQSPFNVGFPVELSEFTVEQVEDLAKRHQLQLSENDRKQLMDMVGGHPYLIRLALYELATNNNDSQEKSALDLLLQNAATEAGIYRDYLRRHLSNLEANPDLATAMENMVASESISLKPTIAYKLNSTGLTRQLEGDRTQVRCKLYRDYFRRHLSQDSQHD